MAAAASPSSAPTDGVSWDRVGGGSTRPSPARGAAHVTDPLTPSLASGPAVEPPLMATQQAAQFENLKGVRVRLIRLAVYLAMMLFALLFITIPIVAFIVARPPDEPVPCFLSCPQLTPRKTLTLSSLVVFAGPRRPRIISSLVLYHFVFGTHCLNRTGCFYV